MYSARAILPAIVCTALLVAAACDGRERNSRDPGDAQPSPGDSPWNAGRPTPSEAGLYRVSLRPEDGEVPLGRLHGWVVHLETRDGETFLPRRLAFGGGMPRHGHGFETEPRVTRAIGDGDFLVEGVKFHMSGDWTLRVEFVGPAGPDLAVFHVQVGP